MKDFKIYYYITFKEFNFPLLRLDEDMLEKSKIYYYIALKEPDFITLKGVNFIVYKTLYNPFIFIQ